MKERIIGHRGYGVTAPENTLFALEQSAKLGLLYVEFDLRLTSDDVVVISHDDSLKRCAGQSNLISKTPYEALSLFNVAHTHSLGGNLNEKIPTLLEYLEKSYDLNLICQIELKPNADHVQKLAYLAANEIERFYQDKNEFTYPLITSFSPESLKLFSENCKIKLQTGLLVKVEDMHRWYELANESNCKYVHVNVVYLTEKLARDILDAGYKINAYHLNHINLAKRAVSLGCERFTCDIPDVFLKQI